MGKAARKDLTHGGVVVGAFDPFDLEFAVIIPLGLAILINNHRAYRFETADIGYIEGLDPVDSGYAEPAADLVHGADGPQLLAFDLLFILGKDQGRVAFRKLYQALLLPLLRDDKLHLLAAFGAEPLSDDLAVLKLCLNPELPWDERRAGVKLLDEAGQDLPVILCRGNGNVVMLPADQTAFPYEEDLDYRVLVVLRHGDDIAVLHTAAGDLLFLGHRPDAGQQIPVFDGFFEIHLVRRRLHLFLQHGDDRIVFAAQKIKGLTDGPSVLFFINVSLAGRRALLDVVI